ncbi:putative manganese-dependent inorganic diphosphatase [Ruficoccus amylovorans]|uniref:inorganic diphosphatase n=1 Tax=Ruficoccus amylovorans TaxID=1804625 RepID=A0A842HGZ4_9BACT|nr:putative manganese-dependent inorganic diphosphatase [Ruficoccus amylovorans]MBC2595793.1 putative manganese-dependent inorganic diphosphatase [Ruficoccus amylovorans]
MSASTYIIGHKNPDADAICSAIAYAAFKEATGESGYVAARCGNSNARIDSILSKFNVPLPMYVGDVIPRVEDIMRRDIRKTHVDATCAEALDLIDRYDIRALPVVDDNEHVVGVVSIFDLGEFFIPKPAEPRKMRHVHTSIDNIVKALQADVINMVEPERVEDLFVRIAAMDLRSFGKFTKTEDICPEQSIIIVGDRYDIQQRSIQSGVRLLVVTGGLEIDDDVVQMAKEKNIGLIVSRFDSATTSWIIRTATELGPLVDSKNITTFDREEKLSVVRRRIAQNNSPIYCVVDDSGRLEGVFTKTDLLKPVNTRLVLVDHNELGQAVNGAGEVNIVEIVDHHRLGNPPTAQPILFRNEIIGSTCSIIAELYRSRGIDPTPQIAGVLMGGIISDTLNLQSPTTTERDANLLPWLSKIAGVETDALATLIFTAGSIVVSESPEKVITSDCKQYEQGEIRYSVSQVEELGFNNFWKKSADIQQALSDYQTQEGLSFSCLLVTDINTQNSLLLVEGDEACIEQISFSPVGSSHHIFELPGIVSRKKQVIPYFSNLLSGMGVAAGG